MEEREGYKREKLTINLVWAHIFSVLILVPIIIVFGIPYYMLWTPKLELTNYLDQIGVVGMFIRMFFMMVIYIVGVVLHELIHGITWSKFTKQNGFRSLKFGVIWEMMLPYCHCKEPLRVKHYILGAITPAIFLGFLPSIIGVMIANIWLLLFGIIFTMAASGDFLIINLIRKENSEDFVQDHPSEVGCYIFRKIE